VSRARVARAVAAARAVGAAHGVGCDDARALQDGINVVVHLAPAPVVARVATLTRLLRPDVARHLGREVAVAGALAAAGAPVVPPSDLLPPGPHEHDGTVLSFWTYVRVLPEAVTPAEVAGALTELEGPLGALADAPSDAELAPWLELRRLHAAAWSVVAATGHPQRHPAARERLTAVLG
jgi:hypothetical protein